MRRNETIQLLKALQTTKSDTAATLEEALGAFDDLNAYLEMYALQMDGNHTIATLDEMSIDILDDLVGKYLKIPSKAAKTEIMTFLQLLLTEDPTQKIDDTLNRIWKSVFDPLFLGELTSEPTFSYLRAYAKTQPPGTVNFKKILEDNPCTGVLVFTEAEATEFFNHSDKDDGARNIQKRKRLFDTTPDKSPNIQINPISPYSTCLQASLEELKTQTHTQRTEIFETILSAENILVVTAPNEHTRSEFVKQYEDRFPGAMIAFNGPCAVIPFNDPCAIPLHILKVTKAPTDVVLVPHYKGRSSLIGYIALFPIGSSFLVIQNYAGVLYGMGICGPNNRFKSVEQPYSNKNDFRFGVLLTLSDIDKLNAFAKSDKTSPSMTFQISAHESKSYRLTFNWQQNEQHILLDSDMENAKKFMALLSQFGIAQPDGSEKTLLKYEDERGYATALNDSEIEKLHQALQGRIAAGVLTSPVTMFGQRVETINAPTEVTAIALCCANP